MSKQTVKRAFAGLVCVLGLACSPQSVRVLTDDPMVMLRTQHTFKVRSNPCGCIVNRQALDYEVQLGSQWRRVFIEPTQTNPQALERLKSLFLQQPRAHHQINARFLEVFYQWLPGHKAPGMAIDGVLDTLGQTHGSPPKAVQ